jgi:antitoxin component of MazEF toxin-antitoxin module
MVKELDQVSKIIKVGSSIGITISKNIQEILDLEAGDYVKISIEKIEKEKKE